jgi:RHS repeat-associated protein
LETGLASRNAVADRAFAPYGETYANVIGVGSLDFTGDRQDIFAGLFDTPNRELNPSQGRWLSPDPAHASWNAYSYPTNPNLGTDPSGACDADQHGEDCTGNYSDTPPLGVDDGTYAADTNGAPLFTFSTRTSNVIDNLTGQIFDSSGNWIDQQLSGSGYTILGTAYDLSAPTMNVLGDVFVVEMSIFMAPAMASSTLELGVGATISDAASATTTVVNLGGEGEVLGAINVQVPGAMDGQLSAGTAWDLQAAGNKVVIADNTALPFADQTVDTVVTNNVPLNTNTWLGPSPQTSEINRILVPGGQWYNNGVAMIPW